MIQIFFSLQNGLILHSELNPQLLKRFIHNNYQLNLNSGFELSAVWRLRNDKFDKFLVTYLELNQDLPSDSHDKHKSTIKLHNKI